MYSKQRNWVKQITGSNVFSRRTLILLLLFLCSQIVLSDDTVSSDKKLLDQFIQSRGSAIITFDASNIKQFWIDNSVVSFNDHFEILLDSEFGSLKSIPLKIQLANVKETMDCKVDVIAQDDLSFSVLNSSKKKLSDSQKDSNYIQYKVASSVFHLEDAEDNSFYIVFSSSNNKSLKLKSIVLSFPNNPQTTFLSSPGTVTLTEKNIILGPEWDLPEARLDHDNTFSVTGKKISVSSKNSIYVSDTPVILSGTIKNIGDTPTRIYVGYATYSQNREWINHKNYPYTANSPILKVVSAQKGSDKIIVDSYNMKWAKGSFLALNAKDDLSDVPNSTFADGTISDVKQLENGHAEITMTKPLQIDLKNGSKVRVHGGSGAFLYAVTKVLQPGEEEIISHTIKKDESSVRYSIDALTRGMYFIKAIILSYSVEANETNTVLIDNFVVSF